MRGRSKYLKKPLVAVQPTAKYKQQKMKQFVTFIFILLCFSVTATAQTYLEQLQKRIPGLGHVTITQSKAIDELVNGKGNAKVNTLETKANTSDNKHEGIMKHDSSTVKKHDSLTAEKKHDVTSEKKFDLAVEKKAETTKEDTESPSVDMSKKVMRSSYKVTGFRVQAYAGGNSRADRQKAEQIGNAIKMKFPDQPVYVHFYSPRWICRVGNYRTQAEASAMLRKIKAMGYKQACLVKGKITVQD